MLEDERKLIIESDYFKKVAAMYGKPRWLKD
jgi:hypothetical protein